MSKLRLLDTKKILVVKADFKEKLADRIYDIMILKKNFNFIMRNNIFSKNEKYS